MLAVWMGLFVIINKSKQAMKLCEYVYKHYLSSSNEPGGQKERVELLLTGLFDFYDEVLEKTECMTKAKEALVGSKIPPDLRNKITAERFKVRARPVLTLMQRLELKQTATHQPLAT